MSRCLSPKRHFPSKISFPLLALGLLPLAALAEDRIELEPMQVSGKSPAPVSVSAQTESERLARVLECTRAVDTAAVAAAVMERGGTGPAIGDAIRRARIEAVKACPA